MNDQGNGVEVGVGNKYLRITGRDFLLIVLLGVALGFIVWSTVQGHHELVRAIEMRCGPNPGLIF